ncbi:Glutamate-aspartate carrier protein [Veillonella criceti]|uniref:Glutamate-aspartate carrier protein n=1 Tax=Veillonella criceti TaxID=103891 RepID=A0A380NFL3_9FIRM|nr:Glutamate-aspartate carrier protein [Veillonella criceti]
MGLLQRYQKTSLLVKLLGAMVIGSIIGVIAGKSILFLEPLGKIFLQLLKMAALPLIFFNLIAGISTMSDPKILGRVGSKIMVYYLMTTACALFIAFYIGNLIGPGYGLQLTEAFDGKVA